MNTSQIKSILSSHESTKKIFLGVFPSDMLPTSIKHYPTCFVCNVDTSNMPGSHWLAFYIPSLDKCEFFDSFGNPPGFFNGPISDFCSRFPQVTFNPITLQTNITAVCGQYTIYFLINRCRNESLKRFLTRFVCENISNDQRVYNFVAKRFRVYVNFFQ